MKTLQLISKHMNLSKLEHVEKVNTLCAFTGESIKEGIHKKFAIKGTFTDFEFLKYPSEYIGTSAAATMANILQGAKGAVSLRNYSFITNENELILLKNSEILTYLIHPLPAPFHFCISFNNKKHLAFKSKMNLSNRIFTVTTDIGDCIIDSEKLKSVLPILQKWYSLIPEKANTSTRPTWFTKEEILRGSTNIKKINAYGPDYFMENQFLDRYRNTLFLKVLVHSLIKSI